MGAKDAIPVNEPLLTGNEAAYLASCANDGWISSAGAFLERFEREWARYCDRRHGVAVANGTVALELAVSALKLPAGAKVIIPSFTIVSCIEAVLRNGLEPVLVDCDPRTFCMDVAEVESKAPGAAAVMPVHIYGHPVNMEPLRKCAELHGLKIVEDAAEAHGSQCLVNGAWRVCGSFGDVSCFSFYANKNISCGEGGMVLTDDDAMAELLRSRRSLCFGAKDRFKHEDRGWNFRMTNMQAAIGCAQLERIDAILKRKLSMAASYSRGLKGLPLQTPHVEPWAKSSVWMYAVVLDDSAPFDAAEFALRLMREGVQTRPFFLGMHEQPAYKAMGLFHGECYPNAERISRRGLYLPSGQAITDAQVDMVVKSVKKVLL